MKIGDLVTLCGTGCSKKSNSEDLTGVIIDLDPTGWRWVLNNQGVHILWPEGQMEKVNE